MMGNFAAQKFELQARVAPSGKKILAFCFWVRNILPRGLIGILTKMANFFLFFDLLDQIFGQILGTLIGTPCSF